MQPQEPQEQQEQREQREQRERLELQARQEPLVQVPVASMRIVAKKDKTRDQMGKDIFNLFLSASLKDVPTV